MAREYYSIPEAAVLLGLSRIAVFKRVKAGRMAALRIGRNWAVPAAELERVLPAGAAPTGPARPPQGPFPVVARPASAGEESPPADEEMDSMGWD